ncbi:MAG: hypothetical protein D6819_07280 [Gammaproteobacteria bacterium]|nr:MAG: hypothetical protein D6819_07280 [Gammaproteobacteria bacterium]
MQTEAEVPLHLALKAYLEAVSRLFGDTVELVALEGQLAGRTLVWMVALGVGAVVLVLAAWGMVNAVVILWLATTPMGLVGALLSVALGNLLIASALALGVFRMSRYLTFPATRRVILRHGQAD